MLALYHLRAAEMSIGEFGGIVFLIVLGHAIILTALFLFLSFLNERSRY